MGAEPTLADLPEACMAAAASELMTVAWGEQEMGFGVLSQIQLLVMAEAQTMKACLKHWKTVMVDEEDCWEFVLKDSMGEWSQKAGALEWEEGQWETMVQGIETDLVEEFVKDLTLVAPLLGLPQ